MQVALQVIALTAFLFLAQQCLRRAGKWVVWGLFLAVPLALTPYWFRVNEFGLFVWVKFYTVFFCVGWGVALRFTSLGDRAWARLAVPVLTAVNILEATVLDALGGGLAHKLNAVAGVLLVATLPYRRKDTTVDAAGGHRDIHLGTSRGWVVGYVLWNWAFVYLNYPAYVGHHTAVLLCGLIVGMIDPRLWAQSRGCLLGINFLGMATFNAGMVSWLDTSSWSDPLLGLVAAGIAVAFMIGYALRRTVSVTIPSRPDREARRDRRLLAPAGSDSRWGVAVSRPRAVRRGRAYRDAIHERPQPEARPPRPGA